MSAISRREFVKTTAICAVMGLSSDARRIYAEPLGLPIGCQTWPVRDKIARDFPGTLKELAATGFVPVGQGTLDWHKIFAAARTGGIQNYFVEMDLPLMRASVPYLRQLRA